eukprot:CAMPEP_0194374398 /NCGR_PEP_ID=MMETSP0174-20130528/22816_1 /TAXON_ID=216777 /ORGANISM="Proboscia alata, Strain PI-D3" /LENGTH=433 /DNA_ID=CAMNT_0039153947 /DNA_START=46 /DNA_END=1343 /DNA_ORIENTATION=+
MKAMVVDHYDALGISFDASLKDIKIAYRQLALKYHPDRVNGADEEKEHAAQIFTSIGAAYETLSDADLKMLYDDSFCCEQQNRFSSQRMPQHVPRPDSYRECSNIDPSDNIHFESNRDAYNIDDKCCPDSGIDFIGKSGLKENITITSKIVDGERITISKHSVFGPDGNTKITVTTDTLDLRKAQNKPKTSNNLTGRNSRRAERELSSSNKEKSGWKLGLRRSSSLGDEKTEPRLNRRDSLNDEVPGSNFNPRHFFSRNDKCRSSRSVLLNAGRFAAENDDYRPSSRRKQCLNDESLRSVLLNQRNTSSDSKESRSSLQRKQSLDGGRRSRSNSRRSPSGNENIKSSFLRRHSSGGKPKDDCGPSSRGIDAVKITKEQDRSSCRKMPHPGLFVAREPGMCHTSTYGGKSSLNAPGRSTNDFKKLKEYTSSRRR